MRCLGIAFRDELVERVLEEEAFEAVARVARGASACACARFSFVVALFEGSEWEVAEELARGFECEVDGVIREGGDFVAKACVVPCGVKSRGRVVEGMVEVDSEVEQAAGREHARQLAHDVGGAFGVVYYVVAQHEVEGRVGEGESLAGGGDCLRSATSS